MANIIHYFQMGHYDPGKPLELDKCFHTMAAGSVVFRRDDLVHVDDSTYVIDRIHYHIKTKPEILSNHVQVVYECTQLPRR